MSPTNQGGEQESSCQTPEQEAPNVGALPHNDRLGSNTIRVSEAIKYQNVSRLCHTKSVVTVNGQFPGPRIVAREGDRLLIKVTSHVQNNISIHCPSMGGSKRRLSSRRLGGALREQRARLYSEKYNSYLANYGYAPSKIKDTPEDCEVMSNS
ncbi:hypothetical protein JHK84_050705 [Glycine max]|nr:hypothetical protein JHK84_050705 [Glycine max]